MQGLPVRPLLLLVLVAASCSAFAQSAVPRNPASGAAASGVSEERVTHAEKAIARLLLCGRLFGARYASEASRLEDGLLVEVEKAGTSLDIWGPPHQKRVIELHDQLTDDRRNAEIARCELALQDSARWFEPPRKGTVRR